jgi:hypothetical protein
MRLIELKPEYCDTIPNELQEGILYISKQYGIAIHLCACGCGEKTVTDLKPIWRDGWALQDNEGKITLRPSIGNFKWEHPYHAHYFITENRIDWC